MLSLGTQTLFCCRIRCPQCFPAHPLILASMTGQLILAKSSSSAFWPPMGARHLSIRSRCTSQKACSTRYM